MTVEEIEKLFKEYGKTKIIINKEDLDKITNTVLRIQEENKKLKEEIKVLKGKE